MSPTQPTPPAAPEHCDCGATLQVDDAEHRSCPQCGRYYELRMVIEGQQGHWATSSRGGALTAARSTK